MSTHLGTHHHLVVELHPYLHSRLSPRILLGDVGLGCGLPIVTSSAFLPYPRSLPRPRPPFSGRLVAVGFRDSPQFDGVATYGFPKRRTSKLLASAFYAAFMTLLSNSES
jgi:hypothetical protein